MERKASCSCGQLGIVVEGEPSMVAACNCIECQKRTGSVLGVGAYFKDEHVTETYGKSSSYERQGDSGLNGKSHFCPNCGSTVFWHAEFMKNHTGVAVGCFADPNFPAPKYSAWNHTRHKWVSYPENVMCSDTQEFGAK